MSVSEENASASLPAASQSIGSDTGWYTTLPSDPLKDMQTPGSSDASEQYPQCKQCGKYFAGQLYLQKHLLLPCLPVATTGIQPFVNELQRRPKKPKEYKCSECNNTFATSRQLRYHQESHAELEESSKCSYCDKVFSNLIKLKRHEKYHTTTRHYKCSFCEKSFVSPSQLQNHERYHTGERPYKCDQCDKTFVTATHLGYHQKNHNQEGRYKCLQCDKTFVIPSQLTVHQRRHTGERPFKCNHCDKGFPSSSQLESHKRSHTGVTSYKKLQYKYAKAVNHNTDQ